MVIGMISRCVFRLVARTLVLFAAGLVATPLGAAGLNILPGPASAGIRDHLRLSTSTLCLAALLFGGRMKIPTTSPIV